jgi:hypothetical protein
MPNIISIKNEIDNAFGVANCMEIIEKDFGVFDPATENRESIESCQIVQKEKGHFQFTNSRNQAINFIEVDKCLIKDNERHNRKCDYAFHNCKYY